MPTEGVHRHCEVTRTRYAGCAGVLRLSTYFTLVPGILPSGYGIQGMEAALQWWQITVDILTVRGNYAILSNSWYTISRIALGVDYYGIVG